MSCCWIVTANRKLHPGYFYDELITVVKSVIELGLSVALTAWLYDSLTESSPGVQSAFTAVTAPSLQSCSGSVYRCANL